MNGTYLILSRKPYDSRRLVKYFVCVVSAIFLAACGNSNSACEAGEKMRCLCAVGMEGESICTVEGIIGPCKCAQEEESSKEVQVPKKPSDKIISVEDMKKNLNLLSLYYLLQT